MAQDYRSTLFLPQTDFPMRGNLPVREPEIIARWQKLNLYQALRDDARGRKKFVLHDGPPYANGNIHIGHAMNKVLKDVINRYQQMMGKDAPYVPGWDCHGLPIEWKIEEEYRAAGKDKDEVPVLEFREVCRKFAAHWIEVQSEEFIRLGVIGDWERPYTTMTFDAEAQIVRELLKFLMNGGLYRGSKPVMWSVVEKTALAEAEVEYADHTSTIVDVAFPVNRASHPALEGAQIVIWTTTPWTLPGNRAIAYGEALRYAVFEVTAVESESLVIPGTRLVVAVDLAEDCRKRFKVESWTETARLDGGELAETLCHHPWHGQGYDFDVPLLPGPHVTLEQGTGFVHTAPGHGDDDYELGRAHGLEMPFTVADDGRYYDTVPLFSGIHVFKADGPVLAALETAGALLAHGKITHSYPHSWRSRAPLIFRNTPQWFISMETNDLRQIALAEIDRVRWVPAGGRNRIHAMVAARPDWVVSRQRAWGVPITVFFNKSTGQPLCDAAVNQRILEAIEAEGADAWFSGDPARFLGSDYDLQDYEKVGDILDVWFDSGASHAYVLEQRAELQSPASLYLEGSDQHRGWFHSSLLESCGTRGHAPYEAVLTHGFVLAEDGRKMSKSLGNVVAPQTMIERNGADILRLWVASTDYSEDVRIGPEIIRAQVDAYRKIRNTLRFMLGNLADLRPAERIAVEEMPELERWVLHRLSQMDGFIRQHANDFLFHPIYTALYNFMTVELSSFYLDIRKDALYCDARTSLRRRAARTVLDEMFSCLTAWFAPILCFTMEEAWSARFPDQTSVHLRQLPEIPDYWRDDALGAKWEMIRKMRRVVTGALEIKRRDKTIGASLEAAPIIYVEDDSWQPALADINLAEIAITSAASITVGKPPEDAFTLEDTPGIAVGFALAEGRKCDRCWQILPEVGAVESAPGLCRRCEQAVELNLANA